MLVFLEVVDKDMNDLQLKPSAVRIVVSGGKCIEQGWKKTRFLTKEIGF